MKIPTTLLPIFCLVPFGVAGCDGYGEDAGEKVDETMEDIEEGAEEAADDVEDALEEAGDEIEDATDGK